MDSKFTKVKEQLKKYNQEQLLQFYHELTQDEKEALLDEIIGIDFELIQSAYDNLKVKPRKENKDELMPLKAKVFKTCSEEEKKELYNLGLNAIKEGRVAVYLVAGGQGSRLGHKGPKGTFSIGLPSGKSLFQLQLERLINLSRKAGRDIPLYVMTSEDNHEDTVSFFEANNYFGYKNEMIMFFKQSTMPAINEDGKVLLTEKGRVNMSPNGNGGCFIALKHSGALEDMRARGVEWVFLYGIDNALVRVADPYFIGFTISSKLLGASKAVAKKYPEEKTGIICYRNDKPAIVEYSELPKAMSEKTDGQGKLLYSNSNILNHILNISFIDSVIDASMPLHIAHKKTEFIDKEGRRIEPTEPNGYKFEYFLFDVFERLKDMAVLEVEREEEFAPVKNREGEDSPKTARELMLNLHRKWLINAGVDEKVLAGREIEISPLISYYGENLSSASLEEILKDMNQEIL